MPSLFAIPDVDSLGRALRLWTEWHGAWRFALVFLVVLAVVWAAKSLLFRAMERIAVRTGTDLDDTLVGALRWPARYWVVLLALVIAVADLDERDVPARVAHALSLATLILLTISVTVAVARVSIVLLEHSMRRSATGIQITTLTKTMIRLFWAVPAVLIILSGFGIQAWPALATLGVGGIAVSFALKDTLANVFSGFYVSLAGQLHKGDFIRLDQTTEGYVMDIHWRITTLRTLDNNMVLIPNSKLAEAIVTNFSQPAAPLSVPIPYGVAYDTDIELLDRVVLEEVRDAIGQIAGLLPAPAPVNRLNPGFGDSALDFTLVVAVSDVAAQYAVTDLLRRRLLARFRREGIRIPFPTRTLEIQREPGSPPPPRKTGD
ncbi:MAG: mechanosensitive ion channel family protein [Bryobacteraceae bacterium]|jgi:small-conductance mechanosensitive channel